MGIHPLIHQTREHDVTGGMFCNSVVEITAATATAAAATTTTAAATATAAATVTAAAVVAAADWLVG